MSRQPTLARYSGVLFLIVSVSWAACKSDEGSSLPCFFYVGSDDPSDGCFCLLPPNEPEPHYVPFERSCEPSEVGSRAICCRSEEDCYCKEINCFYPTAGGCICTLGIGAGGPSECYPTNPGTSVCCIDGDGGGCSCNEDKTECQAVWDEWETPSCNPEEMTPYCDSGSVRVTACD